MIKQIIFIIAILLSLASPTNATVLSDAAAALSAGQWSAAITTGNFQSGNILRPHLQYGSSLEYMDKAVWNPVNLSVMNLGGAHGSPPANTDATVFARYLSSTDAWQSSCDNTSGTACTSSSGLASAFPSFDNAFPCGGLADGTGCGIGHGYHHNTIVPSTGDFYHRQYGSSNVMKFSHASQTWSQCSARPGGQQVAGALEYFPDRNSLIYLDGDWGVWELSLASGNCLGAWAQRASTIGGGFSPQLTGFSSYHNQSIYSSACQCILLVGQQGTTMWRMNSNATFTQVASTPLTPGIPQAGAGAIFTVDPVGGAVLMWHNSNAATTMYAYNPLANSWSTISRTSPIFPGPEGGVTETLAIPISNYGVILFVQAGSTSGGQVRLYKHAAGTPDVTPPTAPSNLVATPSSSTQIGLTWTASTDAVGVTGYLIERSPAGCGAFVQVGTSVAAAFGDSGLTASTGYCYRVRATDAASNLSGYSNTATATTQAGAANDFATRCAAPGVVRCFGFDSSADLPDFAPGAGNNRCWGCDYGIGPNGSITNSPTIDTNVKAGGAGSMHFVMPSGAGAAGAGSWFTNFSSDKSVQLGPGDEIWIQVRVRHDAAMLVAANWPSSDGFKVMDAGTGDTTSCNTGNVNSSVCSTSCSDMEVVTQNVAKKGKPTVYATCGSPIGQPGLSSSQSGTYQEQPNNAGGYNCLYPGPYNDTTCWMFHADEWATLKYHIKIGQWNTWSSTIELYAAHEGQPSQLIISCKPSNTCLDNLGGSTNGWYLYNSNPAVYKMGKVWLLPYQTNLQSGLATGNVWYDELIISQQDIADPGGGTVPSPSNVRVSRRIM